jgi:molecular chaperone HscB
VQHLPPAQRLFVSLELPETYFLDPKVIEDRFRDLNRTLHPDRFTMKSPRERRYSLEWTTAVNDAYRILKDPLRRAVYILELHGLTVENGSGGGAMQGLPPDFLDEVLGLREALAEASAERDLGRVRSLATEVNHRAEQVSASLRGRFERFEASQDPALLAAAAGEVAVLRYYRRFAEEVETIEMEALE